MTGSVLLGGRTALDVYERVRPCSAPGHRQLDACRFPRSAGCVSRSMRTDGCLVDALGGDVATFVVGRRRADQLVHANEQRPADGPGSAREVTFRERVVELVERHSLPGGAARPHDGLAADPHAVDGIHDLVGGPARCRRVRVHHVQVAAVEGTDPRGAPSIAEMIPVAGTRGVGERTVLRWRASGVMRWTPRSVADNKSAGLDDHSCERVSARSVHPRVASSTLAVSGRVRMPPAAHIGYVLCPCPASELVGVDGVCGGLQIPRVRQTTRRSTRRRSSIARNLRPGASNRALMHRPACHFPLRRPAFSVIDDVLVVRCGRQSQARPPRAASRRRDAVEHAFQTWPALTRAYRPPGRLDSASIDAGAQVREAIDEAIVDDDTERLGEGVRFSACGHFRDCLAGGGAARRAGRPSPGSRPGKPDGQPARSGTGAPDRVQSATLPVETSGGSPRPVGKT